MPLTEDDVKRIEGLGFKRDYFARTGRDGVLVLNNKSDGLCVFHDGSRCTIYEHRPEGCRLYPLVWSPRLGRATLDTYCPYRYEFRFTREDVERLKKLVSRVYGRARGAGSLRETEKRR